MKNKYICLALISIVVFSFLKFMQRQFPESAAVNLMEKAVEEVIEEAVEAQTGIAIDINPQPKECHK